jgi:hypothetical protein
VLKDIKKSTNKQGVVLYGSKTDICDRLIPNSNLFKYNTFVSILLQDNNG